MDTDDTRESLRDRLTTALPVAVFMFVMLSFPVLSDRGDVWLGCVIAVACVLKAVFDHHWPALHQYMLSYGIPSWLFEEGWRSNLVASVVFGAIFAWAVHPGDESRWLADAPYIVKFALFFAIMFALLSIGDRIRRAIRMR